MFFKCKRGGKNVSFFRENLVNLTEKVKIAGFA